ncbi:MAG: 2-oxoglutarate dehydrogenase, E2 component, dihydrolipoamide succinyltransferase [Micromonosporaceae bacterium]|nr:2-oxoglutarate dehydrogenase, E2 component, dihydrolipoamide succinyltransferase [Micromonosporaceae bacterium]
MPVSVTLPQLGESVTEGTVTRWLKSVGDRVQQDEPLLEVSTDKVDTEIPAPATGIITQILVAEDETVAVGADLAVIAQDGEQTEQEGQTEPAEQGVTTAQPATATPPTSTTPSTSATPPVEPAADVPSGQATLDVAMPALGESVTEGTVTRWLKSVGDRVQQDEPLLEVSTDKVDTEIPAPATGVLLSITVEQDETAQVGAVLAVLGLATVSTATPEQAVGTATPEQAAGQATPPDSSSVYVTPLVRRLAATHGIDLGAITGTGSHGRIRQQDVLDSVVRRQGRAAPVPAAGPSGAIPSETGTSAAATPSATAPSAAAPSAAAPSAAAGRGRTEPLTRLRALIARRMVESLQVSAQLTTVVEADVTRIAQLRARTKDEFASVHGVKLTFLPFFALACVEALRVHPKLNAQLDLDAGTVTYHEAEHLGIAVDTERGLMVPVIHNAGDLNLPGLARRIADLAERTRGMKLSPDEAAGGTFTLTNTGSRGALFDTPIINQPQVAILGTGAVVKRAVVVNHPDLGEIIAPRSMVYLALSYDHRLVDGADAARFLTTIKERLEAAAFERDLGLS